jgi:hypothetical protein
METPDVAVVRSRDGHVRVVADPRAPARAVELMVQFVRVRVELHPDRVHPDQRPAPDPRQPQPQPQQQRAG